MSNARRLVLIWKRLGRYRTLRYVTLEGFVAAIDKSSTDRAAVDLTYPVGGESYVGAKA